MRRSGPGRGGHTLRSSPKLSIKDFRRGAAWMQRIWTRWLCMCGVHRGQLRGFAGAERRAEPVESNRINVDEIKADKYTVIRPPRQEPQQEDPRHTVLWPSPTTSQVDFDACLWQWYWLWYIFHHVHLIQCILIQLYIDSMYHSYIHYLHIDFGFGRNKIYSVNILI